AGVRDQLQAQPEPALLARLPWIGMARRAIGRRFEVRIAEATIAAMCQHDALADFGQVGERCFVIRIEDLRADRDFQRDVLARSPVAVLAHPMVPFMRLEVLLVALVDRRVEAITRFDNDIATASAIAAARPAELDEFFAAERDAAVAAVAGANIDLG